jgi:hypothetical protein
VSERFTPTKRLDNSRPGNQRSKSSSSGARHTASRFATAAGFARLSLIKPYRRNRKSRHCEAGPAYPFSAMGRTRTRPCCAPMK